MTESITPRKKRGSKRCPRCRSVRLGSRLDGGRYCARCGQRIAQDGRLIPSADRRDIEPGENEQLILI